MKKPLPKKVTNQTYSNRVLRAEFDENWKTNLSPNGNVFYVAVKDNAKVELLLNDGTRRLVVFKKSGYVLVSSGGTSHFSKPHWTIELD